MPISAAADAHFLVHEIEALPAAFATVRSKHGMGAQDVHLQLTTTLEEFTECIMFQKKRLL